ncbi:hypothetical protein JTE90_019208 [Oedothorax gibbosus]|uniref:Uncharacterized protein n=1 Tax=Oedothorax gibbosus TaxID=931172 RepID=A0AAV6THS8_9ARAC|nr:hypothetical protein JTE90_019208 [Oedothorax gibbosus]
MVPRTHFGQTAPVKGTCAESVSASSLLNVTFPTPLRAGDSALGFSRFTRVTKGIPASRLLEHSKFIQVNLPVQPRQPVKIIKGNRLACSERAVTPHVGATARLELRIQLRLFNRNNFNIRYWASVTAAAGTWLAPPIDNR